MHIDIFIHTPTLLCALFWFYLSLQCQNYCFICICLCFSELLLHYDCTPIRRGSGGGLKQQLMKLQNFYHNPGATYIEMQLACFRLCCNLYMSGNFDTLPLWSLNVKSGCPLSCQICLNMASTFFLSLDPCYVTMMTKTARSSLLQAIVSFLARDKQLVLLSSNRITFTVPLLFVLNSPSLMPLLKWKNSLFTLFCAFTIPHQKPRTSWLYSSLNPDQNAI